LDYPPFFAYFEKLLSIPAYFVDNKIVDLNNLNYDAWSVIAYQRTTVILTELVLGAVLIKWDFRSSWEYSLTFWETGSLDAQSTRLPSV
jgi:alpha-1,3-glucosyltransferase